MSTSSGSRVRRLGTMAMSSNPYARRPDLPIPISTSTFPPLRWRGSRIPPPGWRAVLPSVLVVGQDVGGRRRRVARMLGRVLHAIAEPRDAVDVGHLGLPAAHDAFD